MYFDLTPYKISKEEYDSSPKKMSTIFTIFYDPLEKYGIDTGYFNINGSKFEIYNRQNVIICMEYLDWNKLMSILNIKQFNNEKFGFTRDNLDKTPVTFVDSCINDIFEYMVNTFGKSNLFIHDVTGMRKDFENNIQKLYILYQQGYNMFHNLIRDICMIIESFIDDPYITVEHETIVKIIKKNLNV